MTAFIGSTEIQISPEDLHILSDFQWTPFYPKRKTYFRTGHSTVLHRLIVSCPKGMVVDHIDGDTFNNQRSNLRIVNHWKNMVNRRRSSVTGFAGVYAHSCPNLKKPYYARIQCNHVRKVLGSFETPEEAYSAYLAEASRLGLMKDENTTCTG